MAFVTFRRVLALALVGLVLALSGASAASARVTDESVPVPAIAAAAPAPVSVTPADQASAHSGDRSASSPCALRAECGGGWALGGAGAGLLLAVVVAVPSIGGRVVVTPLLGLLRSLVSRLVDGRLFHPPQFA